MGKANEQAKDKPSLLNRWLNGIEKVGNKLPHPISIFVILELNDRLILSQHIIFIITLLFALIIYKVIPQENTKKKLDIIEYKVYRKRGKCILVIELAISIVMHIIDYSIVYTHIMYSFGLIVILLCMSDGYLKRCVKDW